MVYLDEELKKIFIDQAARKLKIDKLRFSVFTNQDWTDRINDIRRSRANACKDR